MTPLLHVDGLSRSHEGVPALSGLDLVLEAGRLQGLIGPDGAGKTTAMRLVAGLLRPDSGHVRVAGLDVRARRDEVRPLLGYMPQRFSLYPDLSVDENLRFFADLHGLSTGQRRSRRGRLLEFSRLEPFVTRRAGALSGGMKQKLALACTLIHEPRLLVLDEPTTGVDPVSRREFWNLLAELAAGGMGIWASTPYMDEAQRCAEIQLLHLGRVIAQGTPEAVAATCPRHILRVEGATPEVLAPLLAGLDDVDLRRFGHATHVVCDPELGAEAVSRLGSAGWSAVAQAATLEDAFFERVAAATEPPA